MNKIMIDTLRLVQDHCHNVSVEAGWWNDLETGESYLGNKHVYCEKIALIHSEVSEALEGLRKDLMDDHLPHREMAGVEMADILIRVFDLAGALGYDVGGAMSEKLNYNMVRPDHQIENRMSEGGKKF